MKLNRNITNTIALLIIFSMVSCTNFLEEENLSSVTDVNYLTNEAAFEELVIAAYAELRSTIGTHGVDFFGTDIFTRLGRIDGDMPINDYTAITPFDGECSSKWNGLYGAISECNVVISRAEDIEGIDEQLKAIRIAEVKTLRAMHYFNLVEQFGGVPIVQYELREVKIDFERNTEEEVYNFLISDLQEAIFDLPSPVEQFGRVSKEAAQHLLSLVYLTKGYKSFGSSSDFEEAAALAESVIASPNHQLLDTYGEVFGYNNQINKEIIFSVQFSTNELFNGGGNNRHQYFKFWYDLYPGMARTADYGKAIRKYMMTDHFYQLFADGDSRDEASLHRVLYAVENKSSISVGDTVIYFPKEAWTRDQKNAVDYYVYNPNEYVKITPYGFVQFPLFKKFDDLDAPYDDGRGTRDAFLYRLAETYLIAAEAHLQLGNQSEALNYLNTIRNRAAEPGVDLSLSSIDIDVLLDERAAELAGEVSRWMSLKRTGRLLDRALQYNPHVKLNNASAIDENYLLRPIPESEILLTAGSLTQNPGY